MRRVALLAAALCAVSATALSPRRSSVAVALRGGGG